MNPIATRPAHAPVRRRLNLGLVGVLAVGLAAEALAWRAVRLPDFVPEVTVVNPTGYHLEVDVGRVGSSTWLGLGTAPRDQERIFSGVIDHGDQWVFRFSYAGVEAGEAAAARSDLARGGWKVTVPRSVGQVLAAQGLVPSAR